MSTPDRITYLLGTKTAENAHVGHAFWTADAATIGALAETLDTRPFAATPEAVTADSPWAPYAPQAWLPEEAGAPSLEEAGQGETPHEGGVLTETMLVDPEMARRLPTRPADAVRILLRDGTLQWYGSVGGTWSRTLRITRHDLDAGLLALAPPPEVEARWSALAAEYPRWALEVLEDGLPALPRRSLCSRVSVGALEPFLAPDGPRHLRDRALALLSRLAAPVGAARERLLSHPDYAVRSAVLAAVGRSRPGR